MKAGSETLSRRETQLLELFELGMSYEDAATSLQISVNTVREHVRRLYEKLDACSKIEAVLRARALRLDVA